MDKLTWFSIWADVQSEYGTESTLVQAEMRKNILCWIDTEEPEAKAAESLGLLHRATQEAVSEAIEKSLQHETDEPPFVFVTLKFSAEQGPCAEVDRIEARIEKLGPDRDRWRLTVDHRADTHISWHDEAGSALAGLAAMLAQTTKTWLEESAALDPEAVFADRHLTDLQKHLRDREQLQRPSPSSN